MIENGERSCIISGALIFRISRKPEYVTLWIFFSDEIFGLPNADCIFLGDSTMGIRLT